MNLGQLSAWAAANKPAVIGVGAAGAVGFGLLARRKAGGDVAGAPKSAESSYSAGGQVSDATGAGGFGYDSSALDLYSALSPELAGIGNSLGQIQEQLAKKPDLPVPKPPVTTPPAASYKDGYYRNASNGAMYRLTAGKRDYLTAGEWAAAGGARNKFTDVGIKSPFWTRTPLVGGQPSSGGLTPKKK